jgi:tetratricopeptide (TPR) repeat protein
LSLASISARSGGYFPTTWGWVTLVFGWLVALAVIVAVDGRISASEGILLCSFGGLTIWTWLSALWSVDRPATVLEGERALAYITVLGALVALGRRVSIEAVLAGVVGAATVLCAYGLATRLFPERVGTFDPIAAYRLATPVGYWNGLGIFAAMGSLLALGFVAHATSRLVRSVVAGTLVILIPTLYLTFSRGALLALAFALAVLLIADRRRLQTIATFVVAALGPALAVAFASHSSALTTLGAPLAMATRQGHRLAIVVAVLILVAGASLFLVDSVERRWRPSIAVRRAWAGVLLMAVVVVASLAVVEWGSPWRIAVQGWHSFTSAAPATTTGSNLNNRLFHLSNNGRIVSWKSAVHEFEHAPAFGTGSGTFETWWLAHRPTSQQIRDAHSLYLESLGELGLVGTTLLASALIVPLALGWRRRREAFMPFAGAALLAWIVHAGVDWDWEIPAVTLPALACAAVLVSGAGKRDWRFGVSARIGVAAAAAAIAIFGLITAIGNGAIASGSDALESQNYAQAEAQAKRAAHWAPWSADPWIVQGQIAALNRDPQAARADFRKAIAKDPRNYLAWYGLAGVTSGAAHAEAVSRVVELNPLSDEAKELSKGP